MPPKVSNTPTEGTSTRVIDTGGGFLIEETIPGKHSSLPTKVIYDPGYIFGCFSTCESNLCHVLDLAVLFSLQHSPQLLAHIYM